jgi:hypothetical protein
MHLVVRTILLDDVQHVLGVSRVFYATIFGIPVRRPLWSLPNHLRVFVEEY